jgi:heavy metal translocating P-type ATPase
VVADMMFGRGATQRDRKILRDKVAVLAGKGPAGWWRIAKNLARYGLGVGHEHPAAPQFWQLALRDAGFADVRFEPVVAEAAIVSGTRAPGIKDRSPADHGVRPGGFSCRTRNGGRMRGSAMLHSAAGWLRRRSAALLLSVTLAGLAAGGLTWLAGAGRVADACWLVSAGFGLAYALWSAVDSLRRGRLGVDVIALLALAGAVAVRELLAAAVISVMLASGRALEAWAALRARHDLSALLDRAPRTARRYHGGSAEIVPLDAVAPGDLLLVASGDVVPVDGMVASAAAVLDESALTGEARPVERIRGDQVRSGVLNAGGPFDLRASDTAAASTYAGIVRLVSEAENSQAPFVAAADRYAMWFLPLTLAVAAVAWAVGGADRAVAVLVVATPCPLILAAPVALVSGLSAAARRGVVVKSGAVLERLARCTTLILDKTGTLTVGQPQVTMVVPAGTSGLDADEVLTMAASLDQASGHVLAAAIVRAAAERGCGLTPPSDVTETAGQGVAGSVAGHEVRLGRAGWAGAAEADSWVRAARRRSRLDGALTVFVAVDGRPAGVLLLEDRMRPDARHTLRAVRRGGITRVVLATGDRAEAAGAVGALAGADEVLAELTPAGKLDVVRREQSRAPVIMTGDGINDAPALALADVGIAMGARGATASSEAADAVLTVDELARLGTVAAVARRTRRIALQSVLAGMGMSLVAMAAAAAGLLPAVWGALLQEAIDVAVILNALRALAPVPPEVRLTAADARLTGRFRAEHQAIRADTEELRAAAQALGEPGAMDRVRHVHRLLTSEVWPHEQAEESSLYPALNRVLGGTDPTAPMSRAHAEIAVQIARLGRLIEDIGDRDPDEADMTDLRDILYGLHAVLRLHTVQEDETYLSLGDTAGRPG